jgi:hypothetical protein
MEKDHSYELNLLQVCPKQQAVWTGFKITFQEKHYFEVSFTFFQAYYLFQIMFLSTICVVVAREASLFSGTKMLTYVDQIAMSFFGWFHDSHLF